MSLDITELSEPSSLLNRAEQQEAEYDWLGAASSYLRALEAFAPNDVLVRRIQEQRAYAIYKAAMQADSIKIFRERVEQAIASYEKAGRSYETLDDRGRLYRCQAMTAWLQYWLEPGVSTKKLLLDKTWGLTKISLREFEKQNDGEEYGRTFNQLSTSGGLSSLLQWEAESLSKILGECVEYGEKASKLLEHTGNSRELASAYAKTAGYLAVTLEVLDHPVPHAEMKALELWSKALEFSEETAAIETADPLLEAIHVIINGGGGSDESIRFLEKALEYCQRTRDRFLAGSVLDWLAYHSYWKARMSPDPDVVFRFGNAALEFAQKASEQYSSLCYTSPRFGAFWIESPRAEFCSVLSEAEVDPAKKRVLLEESIENVPARVTRATLSGYPIIVQQAHSVAGRVLASLAKIEPDLEVRKKLLDEALIHMNESMRLTNQRSPEGYFSQGFEKNYLSVVKAEVAELTDDPRTKMKILEDAVIDKEDGLRLSHKSLTSRPYKRRSIPLQIHLGRWHYDHATLSKRLYELTGDRDQLVKMRAAFRSSAESFLKVGLLNRVSECYWKAAQTSEDLGDYSEAAEDFSLAAHNFTRAGEIIPQLKAFYEEYAVYMKAWREIETARHHHLIQEYKTAAEHYQTASENLQSTKKWRFLKANYLAWAKFETAEDLSRRESEQATQLFDEAKTLFQQAEESAQAELPRLEVLEEKQLATGLLEAVPKRLRYLHARIQLEQAHTSYRMGNYSSSYDSYGQALATLQHVALNLELEHDAREIRLLSHLVRAWQLMAAAEARATPKLYLDAARLFEEAKDVSFSEKARMIVLGHSHFCKALEASMRFIDTREVTVHSAIVDHLQAATDYYERTGLGNLVEQAKGIRLLFDAYVQIDDALRELDPEKKNRLFTIAEKVIELSVTSLEKAGYSGKRGHALTLLDRVRQERDSFSKLLDLYRSPSIITLTATPSVTPHFGEKALGLNRLEGADIHTRALTNRRTLRLNEDIVVKFELVNGGTTPATLVRLEGVSPTEFDIVSKPEPYQIVNGHLDLRGRRLDPLRIEEIRLSLRSRSEGVFTIKPRVFYLDDAGRSESREGEQLDVLVSPIAEFLVRCYADDYMRGLAPEHAGWRTLMDIVDSLKIPKSHVYGDARLGHTYGKRLDALIKAGTVESRIFLGRRGRGGRVIKVRAGLEQTVVKKTIEELVLNPLRART